MAHPDTEDQADEFGDLPIFEISQPDGTSVSLDFTTPGPFGDFAVTAGWPQTDGPMRDRVYDAYHLEEPRIFVEILQHWARVADPDDILTGLDHAEAVLRSLVEGAEATTRSEHDFDYFLETGIEPLAIVDALPVDHQHPDEQRNVIVLAPRGRDLQWISHISPLTTFSVPPSHLWIFVTGMMWRSYDHDTIPLTRLNTEAYETAIAAFRRAIMARREASLESPS